MEEQLYDDEEAINRVKSEVERGRDVGRKYLDLHDIVVWPSPSFLIGYYTARSDNRRRGTVKARVHRTARDFTKIPALVAEIDTLSDDLVDALYSASPEADERAAFLAYREVDGA
jgi:hypothetical protein